jgi:hypothetical protein
MHPSGVWIAVRFAIEKWINDRSLTMKKIVSRLEDNECASNEYHSFDGQYISHAFLHDDSLNSDCLDRTDESLHD